MKKLYKTFLSVLLLTLCSVSGWAYDNVTGTISWAVGNESKATVTDDITAAVQETSFTVGTDLTVSGPSSYTLGGASHGPYVTYQPATGNPGNVPGDMIEYKITMKKGITFTPTSVAFDAVKEGTDNAYFSWSYTVDGKEGNVVAYSDPKNQIRRNNDANPSAPLTHDESITSDGGRVVTLRFYISNVANNKKMSIGNIKVNGKVNGEAEVRAFKNFKVDFRHSEGYVVTEPATGLPEGVTIDGTFHDGQHGYNTTTITVPVDGPVKFTFGTCQYNGTPAIIKAADGTELARLDCKVSCDKNDTYDHFLTWTYNSEEAQTLTITTPQYIPYFFAEACDLLPMVKVEYYNTDGKTLIGSEEIQGGTALSYKYGESDVTIAEGSKFRGWFSASQATAVKIAEGTMVQENIKLYAKATKVEVPTNTSRFIYDLTKPYFYQEDHEAIEIDGQYYNNHGWLIGSNGTIKVNVAGKAYITVGNCFYSAESTAVVTNEAGAQIAEFAVKADADGAETTFKYDGEAGWLTITFPKGSYTHSVSVWNVVEFVEYNETAGFYEIPAGDVSSFLIALKAASSQEGAKIFLPNGTYDLGETVLTSVSGKNISIIGESMTGTIIKNAPPKENEGIGTTATLLNNADGLYMQDLTLQNALDYYGTGSAGRAVCLQDKGKNTICKNVRMLSYQDTYYSNSASRFYWEDSEIHGTVDYLCGDGDVVYNRCLFVNESRERTEGKGDCTVCAPYTSASCAWGYVFLDCKIDTKSASFNLGRSWGGESKAQYIRCQDLTDKLVASRFTKAGMNVAAYKFMEYGTMNSKGNVTTPASNIIEFTHSSGNKKYETVLTKEQADAYTVANIYGEWHPDVTCEQVEDISKGTVFLVDGKITTTVPTSGNFRIANSRGGFGPVVGSATGINSINATNNDEAVLYNIAGQRVNASTKGLLVKKGHKFVNK